jgi:hypothetical protein
LVCCTAILTCRNSRAPTAPWIPRHAPWPEQEVSYYDVLKNDTLAGRSTYQVRLTEFNRTPVYEITGINSSVSGPASTIHDSAVALLTRDSLKSVRTFQTRNALVRQDTVISRYDKGAVTVTTKTGSRVLPVSSNTFDNSILVIAVRAFDLKPGAKYLLTSLATFGPWTKPADLEVLGDDTVTVPAGNFFCRKVLLELAGWTMQLWYERDIPHRYVKFENKNNLSVAVLTRYEPAESLPARP